MKEVKQIGVLSVAKIQATVMAIGGLLQGLMMIIFGSMLGSLLDSMGGEMAGAGGLGAASLLTSIVVVPIGYAIAGFIFGAIGAFFYNLAAGMVGGIEIDLE